MSAAPLYQLRDVKRIAPKGEVILDVGRLTIGDGAIAAIVGPNGAGKSTLLKLLAFLDAPDEGDISFRGEKTRPDNFYELRRQVTMVDQSPLLFRGSVFKNVAYGLNVRGVPKQEWEPMVKKALAIFDLSGYEHRNTRGLSGGETQRVAIARALVFKPEVVLLDEPTAGVDAARIEMVEELIHEINGNGATVIFSTHDLSQAYRLTNNVVHMSAGKIIEHGVENVLSGQVVVADGLYFVRLKNGYKINIAAACDGFVRITAPASCVKVEVDAKCLNKENRFEGIVTRMEMRGETVRLRIDGDVSLRAELSPSELKEKNISVGSKVTAWFEPEAARILD